MARKDLVSALFFICLAVYVCWQSLAMGFGEWGKPGSGFFPFFPALVLECLPSSCFLRAGSRRARQKPHRA